MRCFIQTRLNTSSDSTWMAVKKPSTLVQVARGFLRFSGAEYFPPVWMSGQKAQTRLWFFHIFPAWWLHSMEVAEVDDTRRVIRSHESGGFYTWDHTIQIAEASFMSEYSDEIIIHAGLLTIFIWLYANIFYRYR